MPCTRTLKAASECSRASSSHPSAFMLMLLKIPLFTGREEKGKKGKGKKKEKGNERNQGGEKEVRDPHNVGRIH